MCYVVTFSPLKRERLTVLEHHCVSIVSVSVLSGTGLQPPRFGIRNCIFLVSLFWVRKKTDGRRPLLTMIFWVRRKTEGGLP